jgi:hypothetical protein
LAATGSRRAPPRRAPCERRWQASESSYKRAHELAEQIGWSEVCFDALYGLSNTLRDQGELTELERAHEALQNLGHPLEAARCDLLLGQRLLEDDREAALVSLEQAANEYDELGVIHLAARARSWRAQTLPVARALSSRTSGHSRPASQLAAAVRSALEREHR